MKRFKVVYAQQAVDMVSANDSNPLCWTKKGGKAYWLYDDQYNGVTCMQIIRSKDSWCIDEP